MGLGPGSTPFQGLSNEPKNIEPDKTHRMSRRGLSKLDFRIKSNPKIHPSPVIQFSPASSDDPSWSLSPPATTATPSPSLRPRPPNLLHSNPTRFGAPRPSPPGSHPRLPLPFAPLPRRRHTCRPWGRRGSRTRPANRFPAVVPWRVGARLGLPPPLRLLIGHRMRPLLRGRGLSSHRRCRGGLAPTFRR